MFLKMATTLKGHFHGYNTFNLKRPDSSTPPDCKVCIQVYDTHPSLIMPASIILFNSDFLSGGYRY